VDLSEIREPIQGTILALQSRRRPCYPSAVRQKYKAAAELEATLERLRGQGKKIVFTNGCFDLLHPGHLHLLRAAKQAGDVLVVAINTDASVKRLKGEARPVLTTEERAELLCALEMVDYVVSFDDPDPLALIRQLSPDVLVKGGDWKKEEIVGAEWVERRGGEVLIVPQRPGYSTTGLLARIEEAGLGGTAERGPSR
jgi:rfaE bifunctional protein nucleotidyltransferase chain/domain